MGIFDLFKHHFIRRPTIDPFRLCTEVSCIIILSFYIKRTFKSNLLISLGFLIFLSIFLFEVYETAHQHITGLQPVLSETVHQIYHGSVYLLSLTDLPLLFKIIVSFIALIILILTLWKSWIYYIDFTVKSLNFSIRTNLILFNFTSLFIALTLWFPQERTDPTIQLMSKHIVRNIKRNNELNQYLRTDFIEQLKLKAIQLRSLTINKEINIHLILFESYGKILIDHPELSTHIKDVLISIEKELSNHNWSAHSQLSVSPVFGGGSWLASMSILTGRPIESEAHYRYIQYNASIAESYVNVFHKSDFQTLTMEPGTYYLSEKESTLFKFDHYIYRDRFYYKGPIFGWGVIPDQYALGFTRMNFLNSIQRPYFIQYKLVSSHSPFPHTPILKNWQNYNNFSKDKISELVQSKKLEHNLSELSRYYQSIVYDLQVIKDHILQFDKQNIFVIVGDHQPFLAMSQISRDQRHDYSTLLHIVHHQELEQLINIEKLESYGFLEGMNRFPHSTRLKHEQIMEIVLRLLE